MAVKAPNRFVSRVAFYKRTKPGAFKRIRGRPLTSTAPHEIVNPRPKKKKENEDE